jgi:TonB-dependent receptor
MDNERIRENLQTTFQWEQGIVTATLDYTISSVYTDQYGVKGASGFGGYDTTSMTIGPNGEVLKALVADSDSYFDGGIFYNELRYSEGDTNNKSIGLNLEFAISDDFTLVVDYHDSSAAFKGNPGGSATSTTIFSNGCWDAWDWWPTNETSACFTDRSFDFTGSVVGDLSWSVNEAFQGGADYGNSELEADDMAGREAYINYQDRRSELDQFQVIGTWDNNDGLLMESLVSVDFGISTQETTFRSQKWFNYLKTGFIEDGNPVNLTYGFLPDDVLEKQYFPNIMGSRGNNFYYFYMPKADMMYWFGRATFMGDGNSGDGSWWNANGPARWPSSCYRDDAYDADGNPNGNRVISAYSSGDAYETPTSNWGQLEGCYGDRDSNTTIQESLDTVFVNFNFETVTDQGQELRAQFGLRYEEEERTSISDTQVPTNTAWSFGVFEYGDRYGLKTAPATFANTGSNDYVLPSLNVSFEHAENRVIRFAAGKTIARPALEQLDASNDIGNFSTFSPTVIGTGNPSLEPYESLNYDLAYEYYYKEGSYVAINYFVKEISGYHGSGLNQSSYNGVTDISQGPRTVVTGNYDDSMPDSFCQFSAPWYWACGWTQEVDYVWLTTTNFTYQCPEGDATCEADPTTGNAIYVSDANDPLYLFNLAQPVNKYDGTLDGLELAIQHLFDNGYGVMANVTKIGGDTEVDEYIIGEQFALPGFGDAANFSVFYEDDKVSARVAYNLTGEYYTGNDEYNPLFVTERGTVDFNATYYVNDNIAVFVEGINVTDQDVHLYARYEDMTFLYQDHGPIYKVGFRANF